MSTSLSVLLLFSLSYNVPFNYLFRSKTCSPHCPLYYYSLSLSYKVPFNYLFRSKTCPPRSLLYYYSLSHIMYRSITCLDQRHVHLTVHSIITLSLSYKVPFNYLFRSKTCPPRSRHYYYSLSLSLSYKVPFNYLFRSKTCSPRSLLYYYSLSLSNIKYRSITCLDQRHVHLALGSIITLSLSYKVPFNYLFRPKTCSPRSRLYYYSLSLSLSLSLI